VQERLNKYNIKLMI